MQSITPDGLDGIVNGARCAASRKRRTISCIGSFTNAASSRPCGWANWKAVRLKKDAPLELYDLANDPAEQRDVAAANPEVVAKITTFLASARTESARWPIK